MKIPDIRDHVSWGEHLMHAFGYYSSRASVHRHLATSNHILRDYHGKKWREERDYHIECARYYANQARVWFRLYVIDMERRKTA